MRPPPDVRIAAVTTWLPDGGGQSADDAVRCGLTTAEAAQRDGYLALSVADEAGPVMAVRAGDAALEEAGVAPGDLDTVFHAWIHHQGHDFWSPAHYVAHQLGAFSCTAVGVQQMCNGGAAAIDLALTRLTADPHAGPLLVTTGDRFADPGFDRWGGDYGVGYGDGATAVVLRRGGGPWRVLSSVAIAAPRLEEMHRGDDPFTPAARELGARVDVRRTKKAFLARRGATAFAETCASSLLSVVVRALSEAAVPSERIAMVALPRLGAGVLEQAYLPTLRGLISAPVLDVGRRTGHLGAGDLAANLADLHAEKGLAPGETALLVSGGAGFSWHCLVVRAERSG